MKIQYSTNLTNAVDKLLNLFNSQQPADKQLTKGEKQLLAAFLSLPTEYHPFLFEATAKKAVLEKLTSQGEKYGRTAINNRLYVLLQKGWLQQNDFGELSLKRFLSTALASLTKGEYSINFTFKIDESKS